MMRALVIAGALALMASVALAQGYNPSNVGQGIVSDCTSVIASTGTPQQVLAQAGAAGGVQSGRVKIVLQNTGTHTMQFSWILTNATTPALSPTTTQQYTLQPGSSWTSDPDFVVQNSIWLIGTTGDALACSKTP